jgi:hypothetical protein
MVMDTHPPVRLISNITERISTEFDNCGSESFITGVYLSTIPLILHKV